MEPGYSSDEDVPPLYCEALDEDYWSTEFTRSCVPPMYRHLQEVITHPDDTATSWNTNRTS